MKILTLKSLTIVFLFSLIAGCSNTTTTSENAEDNFSLIEREYNKILEDKISNSDLLYLKSKYNKFDLEVADIFKSETLENPLSLNDKIQLKKLREKIAHRLNILSDLTD